ncbi:MAG: glycosyltransferase family 2 protein [Candidatus Gastranaerophilales bacterium]|nr:glycosyltransferase family 2 protein [Candidatus Gastranaerophilales bacterium]
MKLSVMITFCNQNQYIKEALDSCVNQIVDFKYEILIGLDNGDDEARKIIEDYIEKYSYIKLYEIDNSKLDGTNIEKASSNRLNLLKKAKGEYLSFLDGDDFYCDNNRFQIMVDFLDNNSGYIAAFHEQKRFDENKKSYVNIGESSFPFGKVLPNEYLKTHRQFSCFMYRNIFMGIIPSDFNSKCVNDSSFTYYYLRYGAFYFIPRKMYVHRVGIETIFTSKRELIKMLYALLCAEMNQKFLMQYGKEIGKKISRLLVRINKFKKQQFDFDNIDDADEIEKIKKYAKEQNCYYAYNLINYESLNLCQKIKFHFCVQFLRLFKKDLLFNMRQNRNLAYFAAKANFGDELNLYVLQRLFKFNIKHSKIKKADLIAIGSFLGPNLTSSRRFDFRKINVWGTGFIQEKIF